MLATIETFLLGFAAVILVFGVTPFTPFLLLFFFGFGHEGRRVVDVALDDLELAIVDEDRRQRQRRCPVRASC